MAIYAKISAKDYCVIKLLIQSEMFPVSITYSTLAKIKLSGQDWMFWKIMPCYFVGKFYFAVEPTRLNITTLSFVLPKLHTMIGDMQCLS